MKKSHIIALLAIGGLIAFIISTSSSYSTYETFSTAHSNSGKNFQVVGLLSADKPLHYDPEKDANYFTFYMKDKNDEERKVVYRGPKPQDFERSEQIVLTGKMGDEEFMAEKILLKCPSKYIEEGVEGGELEEKEYEAAGL
ncbi:MAG: cytochrome c maturation protein CcmE [Chitinophagales bacterium]